MVCGPNLINDKLENVMVSLSIRRQVNENKLCSAENKSRLSAVNDESRLGGVSAICLARLRCNTNRRVALAA